MIDIDDETRAVLEKPEASEQEVLAIKQKMRKRPAWANTKLFCDWIIRNQKLIEDMILRGVFK